MILIDTSIWIRHLREPDHDLKVVLSAWAALSHPFVVGELMLGAVARRSGFARFLRDLPMLPRAQDDEVLAMIDSRQLGGRGIGYVDAHLIAALLLRPGTRLWTADRRLADVSETCGVKVFAP